MPKLSRGFIDPLTLITVTVTAVTILGTLLATQAVQNNTESRSGAIEAECLHDCVDYNLYTCTKTYPEGKTDCQRQGTFVCADKETCSPKPPKSASAPAAVCNPGDVDKTDCSLTDTTTGDDCPGERKRTCRSDKTWSSWGACNDLEGDFCPLPTRAPARTSTPIPSKDCLRGGDSEEIAHSHGEYLCSNIPGQETVCLQCNNNQYITLNNSDCANHGVYCLPPTPTPTLPDGVICVPAQEKCLKNGITYNNEDIFGEYHYYQVDCPAGQIAFDSKIYQYCSSVQNLQSNCPPDSMCVNRNEVCRYGYCPEGNCSQGRWYVGSTFDDMSLDFENASTYCPNPLNQGCFGRDIVTFCNQPPPPTSTPTPNPRIPKNTNDPCAQSLVGQYACIGYGSATLAQCQKIYNPQTLGYKYTWNFKESCAEGYCSTSGKCLPTPTPTAKIPTPTAYPGNDGDSCAASDLGKYYCAGLYSRNLYQCQSVFNPSNYSYSNILVYKDTCATGYCSAASARCLPTPTPTQKVVAPVPYYPCNNGNAIGRSCTVDAGAYAYNCKTTNSLGYTNFVAGVYTGTCMQDSQTKVFSCQKLSSTISPVGKCPTNGQPIPIDTPQPTPTRPATATPIGPTQCWSAKGGVNNGTYICPSVGTCNYCDAGNWSQVATSHRDYQTKCPSPCGSAPAINTTRTPNPPTTAVSRTPNPPTAAVPDPQSWNTTLTPISNLNLKAGGSGCLWDSECQSGQCNFILDWPPKQCTYPTMPEPVVVYPPTVYPTPTTTPNPIITISQVK